MRMNGSVYHRLPLVLVAMTAAVMGPPIERRRPVVVGQDHAAVLRIHEHLETVQPDAPRQRMS